ncbi:hypothetical protein D3C72_1238190 [compost metagenome]
MHADRIAQHQVAAQGRVLDVVDKEAALVAGDHVAFDHRVLQRAQHDAVVGIAPGAVVAHDLVAHFHQRQSAAVAVAVVAFPQVVVRIHVVRAVAAVVQPVAAKDGMVRDIDVERVAHEADVVVEDACAARVVELHAIAALRRVVVALAGDGVAFDADVIGLLDPQPEQVVGQVAMAHHRAVRTGADIDAGVLVLQAVAGVAHDQAFDRHVRRRDAQRIATQRAAERGPRDAAQHQRLVDGEVAGIVAARDLDGVPRGGGIDRRLQRLAGLHAPGRGLRAGYP